MLLPMLLNVLLSPMALLLSRTQMVLHAISLLNTRDMANRHWLRNLRGRPLCANNHHASLCLGLSSNIGWPVCNLCTVCILDSNGGDEGTVTLSNKRGRSIASLLNSNGWDKRAVALSDKRSGSSVGILHSHSWYERTIALPDHWSGACRNDTRLLLWLLRYGVTSLWMILNGGIAVRVGLLRWRSRGLYIHSLAVGENLGLQPSRRRNLNLLLIKDLLLAI
mmetsp:Transcript_34056/g.70819  ORF Transcript_34056/g.70819 Transcript_34056/m.70819 type:complete len:222 (+) Transcript_34056:1401-2066(+)